MICLPIVFGIDVKDNFPVFFGAFYKFAYYCKKNNWPIIAQEEYFVFPKYYEEKFNINLKNIANINEIPSINNASIKDIDKYLIADDETNLVINDYKNIDEAWIKMMNYKSNRLYNILDLKISEVLKKYKKIDAFIIWRHNKTIELLAKKYDIRLIEMELSGIRKKEYNMGLCYFQFSNKYSSHEIEKRYKNFLNETKSKKVPVLSRDSLISIFVSPSNIKFLNNIEQYPIGISMGLKKDYEALSTDSVTNEYILKNIASIESPKSIIIRKHPANYNYKYLHENMYTIDNSINSIEFISKCHRIVSSVSNTCFEAMLFGKTSYVLGEMPFKIFSYTDLSISDDYVVNARELNFLIFGYFVPYELALDDDYIKFRLSNPTEIEIYNKHYSYIMKRSKLFSKKKISITNKYNDNTKKINDIVNKNNELNILNQKLEKECNKVKCDNKDLKEELNNLYNSKGWKLLNILRKFKIK